MTEWQPIETAPKDGVRILAWWPPVFGDPTTGAWASTWWDARHTRWETPWETDEGYNTPTHWMLLPPPPSTDKEQFQ